MNLNLRIVVGDATGRWRLITVDPKRSGEKKIISFVDGSRPSSRQEEILAINTQKNESENGHFYRFSIGRKNGNIDMYMIDILPLEHIITESAHALFPAIHIDLGSPIVQLKIFRLQDLRIAMSNGTTRGSKEIELPALDYMNEEIPILCAITGDGCIVIINWDSRFMENTEIGGCSEKNSRILYKSKFACDAICASFNPNSPRYIAYCSKGKNPRIFDWYRNTNIWKGKNIPRNTLQVEIPINYKSIAFIPNEGGNILMCGNETGRLRIYEQGSHHRPIANCQCIDSKTPILSISAKINEDYLIRDVCTVFIGDNTGQVYKIEARLPGIKATLKPKKFIPNLSIGNEVKKQVKRKAMTRHIGAVKCMHVIKDQAVVTASLDRYIHVYDISGTKLFHRIFIFQPATFIGSCEYVNYEL